MIASVSFVLSGNLICNFPQTGQISNFSLINMHEQSSKHQIPKRIRNNANHISSSIMVLQTNTNTISSIKMSRNRLVNIIVPYGTKVFSKSVR